MEEKLRNLTYVVVLGFIILGLLIIGLYFKDGDTSTSKTNNKVKFLKSLNDKKTRQKNKAYYLEGVKVINEVLDKKEAIDIMFIAYSKTILEKVKVE